VVCVGGDGIVHEVVNGLLEKSHGNVGIDLVDGTLPDNFRALPLNIQVGIIPAGASFVYNSYFQVTVLFSKLCFASEIIYHFLN